jgi:hypothetical protein
MVALLIGPDAIYDGAECGGRDCAATTLGGVRAEPQSALGRDLLAVWLLRRRVWPSPVLGGGLPFVVDGERDVACWAVGATPGGSKDWTSSLSFLAVRRSAGAGPVVDREPPGWAAVGNSERHLWA